MYILVVDDNKELMFSLKQLLTKEGYQITEAFCIKDAQKAIDEINYNIILLDWILPDGSGVEWLNGIRKRGIKTPVLLFSSKDNVIDKVEALDKGADDYLQKPFSHIELLARIRALLRRESNQKQSLIDLGKVKLDIAKREVFVEENLIKLSKKEFDLLEFLALNCNVVLTRYQIAEHLSRDFESITSSNIVDAHIKNLRKKLGCKECIETVRGVGYKIKKI